MEIVRINEKKLKLTLDEEDVKRYGVDVSRLDYTDTETRKVLWNLLDEAHVRTGFNAASDRVLIETFPGRRGGCEIYVTLLCEGGKQKGRRHVAYRFTKETYLRSAARLLLHNTRVLASVLYRDPEGVPVLFLTLTGAEGKEPPLSSLSFLEEYGEKRQGELYASYVKEYGKEIFSHDAIEKLCKEENKLSAFEEK